MIHELEIGGEVRPVSFSNYCFRRLKKEGGITMNEVGDAVLSGDVTLLPDVLFYALLAGRVISGSGPSMQGVDADRVSIWMDENPKALLTFMPWLTESILTIKGIEPEKDAAGEGADAPKKLKAKAILTGAE